MTNRLVILSDMWGSKKGLWITSYLGYLQQYYDITFYDCQHLANINIAIDSAENVNKEFINGGIDTAVTHLLTKETEPSNYLAFSTGGTIAWKAALRGLPMKSLYAISSTRLRLDRKSTRLNSSHVKTSYAVFCLKKKKENRVSRMGERVSAGHQRKGQRP